MSKISHILFAAFFVFAFLLAANAQKIPPSYGFLEVVDFKSEPVAEASVLSGGYSEKTDQSGRIEKGIRINPGAQGTLFSVEKTGFYKFIDYFGLLDFLSMGWQNNRENPVKIELLKIPETKAERKIIGKEQQKREFFGAARSGDALAVRKFIKSGLSPNLTTFKLRGIPVKSDIPIIIFAAKSGNGETVKEFLSAGVNVRTKTEPLRDILVVYLSSYYGSNRFGTNYPNTEAERKEWLNAFETGAINLIEAGAEINSGALEVAVSNNYLRTVKKLIVEGANINAGDQYGRTVLHIAFESENKEMIEFLLENGANPNALRGKDNPSYYYCNSPLMMAVEKDDIDLIKLLLGKKANPNLTCQNGKNALRIALTKGKYEIFEMFVEAGADLKAVDENGENNLMYAVRYGNLWSVRKMIEEGNPVNARNKHGSTALIIAVSEGAMNLRIEKVEVLLKARADANFVNEQKLKNSAGQEVQRCETALMYLAANADSDYEKNVPLELIDLLISNKANVNYTCENGQNALLLAIGNSQVKGVKKLIEAGADVTGEKGKIALETARKFRKSDYNKDRIEEIIRILENLVEQ